MGHPERPSAPPAAPAAAPADTPELFKGLGATALARRLAGLEALPPEVKQVLENRRALQYVAAEISKLTWGKSLDASTARSIAAWGREYGVDVLTEMDLLGGKLYRNGNYYVRRLAEMVDAGLVDYFYADFVHPDPRLDGMGDDGKKEQRRRLEQRVKYGIPDAATGACVFHVKLKGLSEDHVAFNWCGGGTGKHKAQGRGDPVGEQEPVKTAETRAARRTIRYIASTVPVVAVEERRLEQAFEGIALEIAAVKSAERDKRLSSLGRPGQQPQLNSPKDGTYDLPQPPAISPEEQAQLDLQEDARLAELERRRQAGDDPDA